MLEDARINSRFLEERELPRMLESDERVKRHFANVVETVAGTVADNTVTDTATGIVTGIVADTVADIVSDNTVTDIVNDTVADANAGPDTIVEQNNACKTTPRSTIADVPSPTPQKNC